MSDDAEERIEKLEATIREMREALIKVDQIADMCRIWGGMEWNYHPMAVFRVKRVKEIVRAVLDKDREPTA